MPELIVIAHNIRSTHNIGAIFRTCDGFGVSRLIISGYSPYPTINNDKRLPYISEKLTNQIHKSALGAETYVPFIYQAHPRLSALRRNGFVICGLEQDERAVAIQNFKPNDKIALLIGEEINGISTQLKQKCDILLEIPMCGLKESFNVSVATGIALYALNNQLGCTKAE